jgi:2',3'-cyclic-nucleotide 2'-phosphodiesterase (5'-nucleotidase family)
MYCRTIIFSALLTSSLLSTTAIAQNYHVTDVRRTRILVDSTYDQYPDETANKFMEPYRHRVDSIMKPVVGISARYMSSSRPESLLSNLLSDIMFSESRRYHEKPAFAVYNIGGIRAALPKGNITYGDILDIAPFENKICFLTLSGHQVMELFREIAMVSGEGVSHGVKLVISKDGKLEGATLYGRTINLNRKYRIATLDYLAQGNDHLDVFKLASNVNVPKGENNNMRMVIINFFKDRLKSGIVVDSKMEGRVTVK